MSTYQTRRVQRLPVDIETAWRFFSTPGNLGEITPAYMNFKTLSDSSQNGTMFAGQIITYTVSPVLGIPLFWMTEITHVKELEYFVDEQRQGPYKMWHHLHRFKPITGGVEMEDIVHYQPPLGFIGSLANALFIEKQVNGIFDYRQKILENRFGKF